MKILPIVNYQTNNSKNNSPRFGCAKVVLTHIQPENLSDYGPSTVNGINAAFKKIQNSYHVKKAIKKAPDTTLITPSVQKGMFMVDLSRIGESGSNVESQPISTPLISIINRQKFDVSKLGKSLAEAIV